MKIGSFYDFYYNFFLNTSAEPNRAHYALAELEKRESSKPSSLRISTGCIRKQEAETSLNSTARF